MDLFVKKTASSFVKNDKIFTIRQRAFLHYIYRYIYTHRTRATRVVIILLMRSKGLFRIYWLCICMYIYINLRHCVHGLQIINCAVYSVH